MLIGDRIARRRKELGLTQDELAARMGYKSKAAISKIETNVNDITQSTVLRFADALDTSVQYLMGWRDDDDVLDRVNGVEPFVLSLAGRDLSAAEKIQELIDNGKPDDAASYLHSLNATSNLLPMPSTYRVPRLGRIACGEPILAEENIEDYDEVPTYIQCDFTLVCRGDSMINARIFDGDIVCIKTQTEIHTGDIAAVLVDGDEATLKRVRLFEDHIVLEPENPLYKPLSFWEEDMNRVRLIGKATHFISSVR